MTANPTDVTLQAAAVAPTTPEQWAELLERHGWNVASAARAIERSPNYVQRALAEHGLREAYDRNRIHGPRLTGQTVKQEPKSRLLHLQSSRLSVFHDLAREKTALARAKQEVERHETRVKATGIALEDYDARIKALKETT